MMVSLFLISLLIRLTYYIPSCTGNTRTEKDWFWHDENGNKHTQLELDTILVKHRMWLRILDSSKTIPGLEQYEKRVFGLGYAVNAEGWRTFERWDRLRANLSGASLIGANLNAANFTKAILNGADFSKAKLRDAILKDVDLSQSKFGDADLTNAFFEPYVNPSPKNISLTKGLDRVKFNDPTPAVGLKRSLNEGGFRNATRQIIAALRRNDAKLYETILFDWTCEYGANPPRAFWLLVLVWVFCGISYMFALFQEGPAGLYLISSGRKVNTGNERLRALRLKHRTKRELKKVFRTAFVFSLMSALNIGFREFNFGGWIRLLWFREFDIKAYGWPRLVSGWQSLSSIYLLALWILTTFSFPFEV